MRRPWSTWARGLTVVVALATVAASAVTAAGVLRCSAASAVTTALALRCSTASALLYPGSDWGRVSPEAAGFSSARLERLRDSLRALPTTSMVAVSGGRIVFEYGDTAAVSYIASCRKSVLAILFGKYVENGTIRLDRTLADLRITDHGGLSDQEREATIADLLAARSGVYHAASNDGDSLAFAPPRGSKKHGTYFLYSNWDFNALGTIFEQQIGRSIYDALETDLARPVGMQDFHRERHERTGDETKSMHLAYHMHFSTRDMARVGYLMLRAGRWGDRQIVSKAWVRRMVTPVTRNTEMNPEGYRNGTFGYGLLWWVFDGPSNAGPYKGAYSAVGVGGQFITVLPRLDLVIAHKVRMGPGVGGVSTSQYFALVDQLVAARRSRS